MKEGNQYYLSENVTGQYSGKLYGHAGDRVTLISIHDVMCIVALNGNRFPTRLSLLSESSAGISLNTTFQPSEVPAESPKRKTSKKIKTRTSSLF